MDVNFWFTVGYKHIITIEAWDHLFYVFALCLSTPNWKKIALLITAFTIGHSITLLLASLKMVDVNMAWVEFLIPITIAITAFFNITKKNTHQHLILPYSLAVFFGLIHGLAYGANDLSSLYEGSALLWNIVAFNLGVECGQLVAVAWFVAVTYVCCTMLRIKPHHWRICLSSIILICALYLSIKNLP